MSVWAQLGWLALGLAMLAGGAEALVRGACRLAIIFGVPPIVVGLTVVAFGTSAPEMLVAGQAAWAGQADVAVGNSIGSNIFNVAVILGIAAIIFPIHCRPEIIQREMPIMLAIMLLLPVFAFAGLLTHGAHGDDHWLTLERWVGIVMLLLLLVYTVRTYFQKAHESPDEIAPELADAIADEKSPHGVGHIVVQCALVLAGLGLLVLGSAWTVDSALVLARAMGVPELVISLTLVAAGTSLPELATSAVAAARKQPEISLGNIIGSNIFNVLAVLGIASTIQPLPLANLALYRDMPVSILVAVVAMVMMRTGHVISRLEGGILLGLFAIYSVILAVI